MKTCAGRIARSATKTPMAKIVGYSVAYTNSEEEKQFLDNNCITETENTGQTVALTIDGEYDPTDISQDDLKDMEGEEMHIFPSNEVSGAPHWLFTGCKTSTLTITGNSGGSITFQASIKSNGGLDKNTTTVP